jgi:hypothetical protein
LKNVCHLARLCHISDDFKIHISVIQLSIDEFLFKINKACFLKTQFQTNMTTTMCPLNHVPGNGSSISLESCICPTFGPFPLQFNLHYYTNSLKAQLNPWQMQAVYVTTLMLRDIIKWTPAYSKLSLYSISLQGPITFALTHSSSS